jgi:hypothetical protein
LADIPSGALEIADILDLVGVDVVVQNRVGVLKTDDNVFGVPKLLYLTETPEGLRIPANFKDIIGARAIYNEYYKFESPADVSGFAGQNTLLNGWRIPFNTDDFFETKNNPNFLFEGNFAKFKQINWTENNHSAVTNSYFYNIFDKNITENEI